MSRPGANVFISNGNLGIQAPGAFGTPVLVLATPVAPVAGYGVAFSVRSKQQVSTAFAQVGNEAVIQAINEGFYREAPEGTELFIVAVVNTNGLDDLAVEAVAGKALDLANGTARLVAFVKFPAGAYSPTIVEGFDNDVDPAVSAAQTLADAWLLKRKSFRCFVQGYCFSNAAAAKSYATSNKRNVAIVVGAIDDSSAKMTCLVLGRASKEFPQRNIGRIKSGSLSIADASTVKLGTTLLDAIPTVDLDALDEKRYIFPVRNEAAPGYVINNDHMLTAVTDDYNNLRYGRVIDTAVRIAYEAYYEELKEDVDVDESGRLQPVIEKALETKIESAISTRMPGQLSTNNDGSAAVQCLVNPDIEDYATLYAQNNIVSPNFNIIQTNKVYIFIRMRPKGSLNYIDIYLGYVSASV